MPLFTAFSGGLSAFFRKKFGVSISYEITPSVFTVNEGGTVRFNVRTTNLPNGTYYWTVDRLQPNGTTTDFTYSQSSGSVVITNDAGTIDITVANDNVTEGTETFVIYLRSGSINGNILATSPSVTINDTSLSFITVQFDADGQSYTNTSETWYVNEGSTATVTFLSVGIETTTYYWSIDRPADFPQSSGSFTVIPIKDPFGDWPNVGQAQFTITPTADTTTEGAETFNLTIRSGASNGPIVFTTTTPIQINDTSLSPPTYAVSPAANNVDEGSSVQFNVTTTDVANGTTLYWTLTNNGDFDTATGSFTITSNAGTFSVTPTSDVTSEGPETFQAQIRTGSTSGTVVATSSAVTINDTSAGLFTPTPAMDITTAITLRGPTAVTNNESSDWDFLRKKIFWAGDGQADGRVYLGSLRGSGEGSWQKLYPFTIPYTSSQGNITPTSPSYNLGTISFYGSFYHIFLGFADEQITVTDSSSIVYAYYFNEKRLKVYDSSYYTTDDTDISVGAPYSTSLDLSSIFLSSSIANEVYTETGYNAAGNLHAFGANDYDLVDSISKAGFILAYYTGSNIKFDKWEVAASFSGDTYQLRQDWTNNGETKTLDNIYTRTYTDFYNDPSRGALFQFNNNGTEITWIQSGTAATLETYSLSTPYDFTTLSASPIRTQAFPTLYKLTGFTFKRDWPYDRLYLAYQSTTSNTSYIASYELDPYVPDYADNQYSPGEDLVSPYNFTDLSLLVGSSASLLEVDFLTNEEAAIFHDFLETLVTLEGSRFQLYISANSKTAMVNIKTNSNAGVDLTQYITRTDNTVSINYTNVISEVLNYDSGNSFSPRYNFVRFTLVAGTSMEQSLEYNMISSVIQDDDTVGIQFLSEASATAFANVFSSTQAGVTFLAGEMGETGFSQSSYQNNTVAGAWVRTGDIVAVAINATMPPGGNFFADAIGGAPANFGFTLLNSVAGNTVPKELTPPVQGTYTPFPAPTTVNNLGGYRELVFANADDAQGLVSVLDAWYADQFLLNGPYAPILWFDNGSGSTSRLEVLGPTSYQLGQNGDSVVIEESGGTYDIYDPNDVGVGSSNIWLSVNLQQNGWLYGESQAPYILAYFQQIDVSNYPGEGLYFDAYVDFLNTYAVGQTLIYNNSGSSYQFTTPLWTNSGGTPDLPSGSATVSIQDWASYTSTGGAYISDVAYTKLGYLGAGSGGGGSFGPLWGFYYASGPSVVEIAFMTNEARDAAAAVIVGSNFAIDGYNIPEDRFDIIIATADSLLDVNGDESNFNGFNWDGTPPSVVVSVSNVNVGAFAGQYGLGEGTLGIG